MSLSKEFLHLFLNVKSGVPQGSVIGPLLFILYVNDLPEVTKNTTVALFADDSKCYCAIQSPADRDLQQTDLDSMHNWSISWQLRFNVSKARSPLGEFVRANSKKVGTDPTFSRRIFSLTNHIAKICFSLRVARKNSPSGERA